MTLWTRMLNLSGPFSLGSAGPLSASSSTKDMDYPPSCSLTPATRFRLSTVASRKNDHPDAFTLLPRLHSHNMFLMLLTPIYLVFRFPVISVWLLSSIHRLVGSRSLLESCFGPAFLASFILFSLSLSFQHYSHFRPVPYTTRCLYIYYIRCF